MQLYITVAFNWNHLRIEALGTNKHVYACMYTQLKVPFYIAINFKIELMLTNNLH